MNKKKEDERGQLLKGNGGGKPPSSGIYQIREREKKHLQWTNRSRRESKGRLYGGAMKNEKNGEDEGTGNK